MMSPTPPPDDATPEQLREYIRALEERNTLLCRALGQSNNSLEAVYKLTPHLAKLMGLLLESEMVTSELVEKTLGISDDARMAMHRLRLRLDHYRLTVRVRRGSGWYFDEETKQKIRARITPGVTGQGSAPLTFTKSAA
jgi:hypothetical protein